MYRGKRVLGVIIARGSSAGVPGKNLRALGGKPLIAWTIEAAGAARHLDRWVLSSDDDAIIACAHELGCEVPFRRPARLATDEVPAVDVLLHALDEIPGFDHVVLLQATSPFRTAEDIDRAIEKCIERGASSCVSVTEARKSPYWMFRLGPDERLQPIVGSSLEIYVRQELPPSYALNGAVYVEEVSALAQRRQLITPETIAYLMPAARSFDIDTEIDFRLAEAWLELERA